MNESNDSEVYRYMYWKGLPYQSLAMSRQGG